jgi:hypothetical protein
MTVKALYLAFGFIEFLCPPPLIRTGADGWQETKE